jgi:hypothetical protein
MTAHNLHLLAPCRLATGVLAACCFPVVIGIELWAARRSSPIADAVHTEAVEFNRHRGFVTPEVAGAYHGVVLTFCSLLVLCFLFDVAVKYAAAREKRS